jgi:hypothetical protein
MAAFMKAQGDPEKTMEALAGKMRPMSQKTQEEEIEW